jgi:hypothetical protein
VRDIDGVSRLMPLNHDAARWMLADALNTA